MIHKDLDIKYRTQLSSNQVLEFCFLCITWLYLEIESDV